MSLQSIRIALLCLAGIFFFVAIPVGAADNQKIADDIVEQLLSRNAQRSTALRAYRCKRVYEVDYSGFPTGHKHASMEVEVTYRAPHHKEFTIVSESGSKLLLNHVLHKLLEAEQETNNEKVRASSDLSRDNYEFNYLGKEIVEGREYHIFRLRPLRADKLLYAGKIWVDAADFAVSRIEAQPAKPPSFWISQTRIEHQYAPIGTFWLPIRNRSTSKVRFGGNAVLTIEYQNYEVNPSPR